MKNISSIYLKSSSDRDRAISILNFFLESFNKEEYIVRDPVLLSRFHQGLSVDFFVLFGYNKIYYEFFNRDKYKDIPKIVIFDPPIRSKNFVRDLDSYYGVVFTGPHMNYYYQDDLPSDRWEILKEIYEIKVRSWRNIGNHIVVAYQHCEDFKGNSRINFYDRTIKKLVKLNRKIVICSRPGENIPLWYVEDWKSWGCEFNVGIDDVISDAYCLITSGGTTQTKAILSGIPSYARENNITNPLGITRNLEEFLKDPPKPDRTNWLNWVAYQQWTLEEMKKGLPLTYLYNISKHLGLHL